MPSSEKANKLSPTDLAKFSVPRSRTWVKRPRLFKLLDEALIHPLIWIGAPAGSGKTTLFASYLQENSKPVLWYNLDKIDSDPAAFFHHLRNLVPAIAPRRKLNLPVLTPDYLSAIDIYAANFFREFFRAFSKGGIIVLDNMQEPDPQEDFLQLINIAVHEAPANVSLACLSRDSAPALFSRVALNSIMTEIGREELKWNDNEIIAMAESLSLPVPSSAGLASLHAQTDGWAAGLILLLQESSSTTFDQPLNSVTEQTLFNYFNHEIFQRFTTSEQRLLLLSAFLPEITEELATSLSGEPQPTRLLRKLVKKNYFTVQLSSTPASYRYHPLFRNFLLHEAKQRFSTEELSQVVAKAASLLIERKNYAAALPIFADAQQWNPLGDILCEIAPGYIAEGRHQSILDWLNKIPQSIINQNTWLHYWKAAALLPIDFDTSHTLFAEAYQRFEHEQNGNGMVLAWAGAVETIVHSLSCTERLDHWVAQLEHLRKFINIETDAVQRVYLAPQVVAIYALRGHQEANIEPWLEIAQHLLLQPVDPTQRIMASFALVTYYHWSGQPARTEPILQQQQLILQSGETAPLAQIISKLCKAWFSWIYGQHSQCTQSIEEGLDIIDKTGVQHWTYILLIQGITNALMQGKLTEARKYFERLEPLHKYARDMDRAYFHNESAWLAILSEQPEQALRQQLTAVSFAESMGAPFVLAETYFGLSQTYHATGNSEFAWHYLAKAREQASRYESQTLRFQCGLAEADYLLSAQQENAAAEILANIFTEARLKGYSAFAWWRRNVISRLCQFALSRNIEVEFIRSFIRHYDIPANDDCTIACDNWPWPVRIHTLGQFSTIIDNEPLTFDRKAQKKPLELLKLLIALGGAEISETRIIDILWPDTEADLARQSLKSTMHRLRKLIPPHTVSVADGKLSLETRYCWVDIFAMEHLAGMIDNIDESSSALELTQMCRHLKNIYHGSFLESEGDLYWSIVSRERYRALFLRSTEKLGEALLAQKSYAPAIECYEYGLAIDPLAERFYQGLMKSYRGMGLIAEVIAVLERCRNVLKATLDINCSDETENLAKLPIS